MTIKICDQTYTNEDVPVELAKDALAVQDACNLSGLVFSLAKVMQALCDHPRNAGTDWRNHHPVLVLWLSKLQSLNTRDTSDVGYFARAYDLCSEVADKNGKE